MKSIILAILLIPSIAFSGPFLVSDPVTGAESFVIECGAFSPITIQAVSEAIRYDLANWPYDGGWHTCNAFAVDSYEVTDETTGETTTVQTQSDPAPFRLKIPQRIKPQNYQVQN